MKKHTNSLYFTLIIGMSDENGTSKRMYIWVTQYLSLLEIVKLQYFPPNIRGSPFCSPKVSISPAPLVGGLSF